jgi:hypothetical protein
LEIGYVWFKLNWLGTWTTGACFIGIAWAVAISYPLWTPVEMCDVVFISFR